MIVKLDIHAKLLQSVRVTQAIMETGVTVSIGPARKLTYDYLSKFFDIRYTLADAPIANVEQSHKEPFVRIGKETRDLLYPPSIFEKSRKFWNEDREGILFVGLVPPHRRPALRQWAARATITATDRGRKGLRRFWDPTYLAQMGKAEFGLCPNGGLPWSYRFFEAVLAGATPIIQTECEMYKGFYYHKWGDTELERKNVEENFELARKRLTMPRDMILANL